MMRSSFLISTGLQPGDLTANLWLAGNPTTGLQPGANEEQSNYRGDYFANAALQVTIVRNGRTHCTLCGRDRRDPERD
jgi:hypothetical protein